MINSIPPPSHPQQGAPPPRIMLDSCWSSVASDLTASVVVGGDHHRDNIIASSATTTAANPMPPTTSTSAASSSGRSSLRRKRDPIASEIRNNLRLSNSSSTQRRSYSLGKLDDAGDSDSFSLSHRQRFDEALTANKLRFSDLSQVLWGRDDQLASLRTCYDRLTSSSRTTTTTDTTLSCRNRRELVWISGVSGTGKSALARHFVKKMASSLWPAIGRTKWKTTNPANKTHTMAPTRRQKHQPILPERTWSTHNTMSTPCSDFGEDSNNNSNIPIPDFT